MSSEIKSKLFRPRKTGVHSNGIPKKLHINGKDWKVELVPLYDKGFVGEYTSTNHLIKIDPACPNESADEIALHEALHICFPHHLVEKELEEKIVEYMDSRLLDFLLRYVAEKGAP